MNSIRKKDIVFILIFIGFYLLSYLFQIYTDKQESFNQLSNQLYSNHHSTFVTNGEFTWPEDLFSKLNYRVFVEHNKSFRSLLVNNEKWSPPMVSGHFFSKNDYEAKAVIGKEMLEYVYKINEKQYISFQGVDYEVTGIMGASFASSTDYLVLLNTPNKNQVSSNSRIILDSDSKSTVIEMNKKLATFQSSLKPIESTNIGLSRTANIPFIYTLLVFEFYLLLLLSVIISIRYWYENLKDIINILYLIGISKRKIYVQILLKAALNIMLSGLVTNFIFLIIGIKPIIIKQSFFTMLLFISISWLLISLFIWFDYSAKGGAIKNDY